MRARIALAQKKAREEAKKQSQSTMEKQRRNADAQEEMSVPIGQYLVNVIIGIFALSFLLGEPTINWVTVGLIVAFDVLWTVFLHRNNWSSILLYFFCNIMLLLTDSFDFSRVYGLLPWYVWLGILLADIAGVVLLYFVYIRKVTDEEERAYRWDMSLTAVLLSSLLGLIVSGVIPLQVTLQWLNALKNLLTHFSVN
jgi:hypothetical protein